MFLRNNNRPYPYAYKKLNAKRVQQPSENNPSSEDNKIDDKKLELEGTQEAQLNNTQKIETDTVVTEADQFNFAETTLSPARNNTTPTQYVTPTSIDINIVPSDEPNKPAKKNKSKKGDELFERGRTLAHDRKKSKNKTGKDVKVKDQSVKETHERELSPLKRAESVITIKPQYNLFGTERRSRSSSRSPGASRSPSPDRRNEIVPSNAIVTSDAVNTAYSHSIFAPITNRVFNATQLHELLISSSVVSTQKITSYPAIPKDQMIFDDISDLDDNKIFKVGYTFKDCSYTPITHGSLVFQDLETGKFIVIGRQNNQFLKPDRYDADIWYSTWIATYMVNPYTFIHFTETHMDNEMKYHFFPGTPFNAEMTEVLMTGAQIKALMKDIDKNICTAQSYDLVHSNCYSAVIYGLTKIFTMIEAVTVDTYEEQVAVNKDLKRLFTLICRALQDNFKAGSGTINNSVVNLAVQNIMDILERRDMLHIVDKTITQEIDPQENQVAYK